MANRGIITQAAFAQLKFKLSLMASSLSFHANGDLSKTHGVNVTITPTVDGSGNPTDQYYDQFGNAVGPYHVGFVVNNTPYYAPAQTSVLGGNSATTGVTEVNDASFRQTGVENWITEFKTPLTEDIDLLIASELLPHALKAHADAHGGMTILTQETFNNQGVLVGSHVIRLAVDGIFYHIPVHTRKGGPKQAWHEFRFSPDSDFPFKNNVIRRARDNVQNISLRYADGIGTLPRTVYLQANNNGDGSSPTWHEFAPNSGSQVFTPTGGRTFTSLDYDIPYPSVSPFELLPLEATVGTDSAQLVATLRLRIEASSGDENINVFSRWVRFYANDRDGSASSKSFLSFDASLFGANQYGSQVI